MTQPFRLIAIHGNGGGGFRFDRILPYMPDHVDFLAPTLPGFADTPLDPALNTMRAFADHIQGIVSTVERPTVLLGTGIGGSFLLEYVQHYADAIDGVILHAPVGTRLDTRRFPWLMKLPGMRAFGKGLFSSRLSRPLFKRLLFADHAALPAEYVTRFFDEYRQCEAFGLMFDLITADWYNGLAPREVPAALLWGAEDRVLNVDHVEDYRQLLPRNRVDIVEGWHHFPMIDDPASYAERIVALAEMLMASDRPNFEHESTENSTP